jgi:3',5'-cyclic AMP phosphodiesterase CpdA
MAIHRLPRQPVQPTHPGGRGGSVRRPFGDPIAYPAQNPRFIPPPLTNHVNLILPLEAVMPTDWIVQSGHVVFHTVGDTGGIHGTETQIAVAERMESQVSAVPDAEKPAFLYHLGDVIYFNGQTVDYDPQFYEPYQYYQPHILAIPGNHDGDTQVRKNDPPVTEPTLTGFLNNFCDDQPHPVSHGRETITQPYVYWTLQAPFATIIGLYSNVDGMLDGRGSIEQQRWFEDQLRAAPNDKCLIVAVHHPPYSLDRPNGGSPAIVAALDQAVQTTGRYPDAVFSGHVHSYQRFTREFKGRQIPYVVAGAGGYADKPSAMHKLQTPPQGGTIPKNFQTTEPGVVLANYNDMDAGFLRITIDNQNLTGEYFTVPFGGSPPPQHFDSFTLDWKKHKVT